MADIKISQLPSVVTVVPASDVLPLVSSGSTTKATPDGIVAAALKAASNYGVGLTPVAGNGVLQLGQHASVKGLIETATLAGVPSGSNNIDVISNAVVYYNTNATQNFAVNIRGNSTTPLNSIMQTGQSVTVSFMVKNGTSAYYPNAFTVDSVSITPKWQNGIAPTYGNPSSVDIYTITVVKTAAATFEAFASQSQFA